MKSFLLVLACLFAVVGCSLLDRPGTAERDALKAELAQRQEQVAALELSVTAMKTAFGATLTEEQKAKIREAEAAVVLVKGELTKLEKVVAELPEGATYLELGVSAAVGVATPYVPRLLTAVPGLGAAIPALQLLVKAIANAQWKVAATKDQKAEDEEKERVAAQVLGPRG